MSKGSEGFLRHLLTLTAFVVFVFGWVGFILHEAGVLPKFGSSYTVKADIPSASLLVPGARITVAGVEVGELKSIDRADEVGQGAELTLEITDDRVTPLPKNSKLAVRTRSQVGEQYVAIDVGDGAEKLADGETLPETQSDPVVDVDQILSVLRGKRRDQARAMLEDTGLALTGRGKDLNATLAGVNPVVRNGKVVVDTLHRQRQTVAKLVDQLGRVTAAVGERGTAIETIASEGLTTLRAIGDRDSVLASTMRQLPATLETVKQTTETLSTVSGKVSPVVDNLAAAVKDVRPAVRELRPAASDGREVVASLERVNPQLDRLLEGASAATKGLPQALPLIRSTFCQLNPALRYLEPYKNDLLQSAFHLGSASNSYDATGHLIRLLPVLNENSVSGAPPAVLDAAAALAGSGAFLPSKRINYNPYIKPGGIGKDTSLNSGGNVTGPRSLKDSGYVYPRVKADC